MTQLLLFHTQDQGELEIVTHYTYKLSSTITFESANEKTAFIDEILYSDPSLIHHAKFNSLMVDLTRNLAIPIDNKYCYMYRTTNYDNIHPELGPFCIVY